MTGKVIEISFGKKYFEREFDENEWKNEQILYSQLINFDDNFNESKIKYIGGLDISGSSKNPNFFIACLVVFDYHTKEIVAVFSMECDVNIPYKAGFLAYKEVPVFLELLKNVKKNHKDYVPNIILIDGNGFWHPRACGSATHFSVLTGIPSIGVSKSFLHIDGLPEREEIEKNILAKLEIGETYKIKKENSNEYLGEIYMATESVKKCLYISVGSGLTLDLATKIVKNFMIYRNNEIIRQADLISRELVRQFEKKEKTAHKLC